MLSGLGLGLEPLGTAGFGGDFLCDGQASVRCGYVGLARLRVYLSYGWAGKVRLGPPRFRWARHDVVSLARDFINDVVRWGAARFDGAALLGMDFFVVWLGRRGWVSKGWVCQGFPLLLGQARLGGVADGHGHKTPRRWLLGGSVNASDGAFCSTRPGRQPRSSLGVQCETETIKLPMTAPTDRIIQALHQCIPSFRESQPPRCSKAP